MKPLTLRDIATEIEMHESTVSRVNSNKYMATPRGTFELNYFFTPAIAGADGTAHSAEAVRHSIRVRIAAKHGRQVSPDQLIVSLLRRAGGNLAPLTLAKYH